MNPKIALWLAIAGLVSSCLAAIGAKSLSKFSPRQLEEIGRRRKSPNRLGEILRHDQRAALAAETLQVAAMALYIGGAAWWAWLEASPSGTIDAQTLWTVVAAGTVLLLAMEIWIPWAVMRLWAAPFVYYTWPLWRGLDLLLFPLVVGARFVDAVLHRLAGRVPEEPDGESFEEEIRTIVTEGHREGLLEEDAREMIEGVIQLGDVDCSEIMTPRTDMVSLPLSRTWDEMIQFAIQAEHTRIPVFHKTRDDIVGILHIKDLLPEMAKPPAERVEPWSKLLREPYFVPETKPVDVLLQEFQRTRHHVAIVLDEYGGVSGLVSMEDVLEEIVGEIGDEYDEELVDGIKELEDGAFEALGRVHIDEINERLALNLPDDSDFDTIGGFVFSELGHIPARGEQLVFNNARITVVDATSRRIERLRIEILEGSQKSEVESRG